MASIQRMGVGDWERTRAVRLRALAEAPDAFATTYEQDEARPPDEWRARLANEEVAHFVALEGDTEIGIAVGAPYRGREECAGLFAMWVAPEARGMGVGDGLVDAVVDWARACGFRRLILEVADRNVPAIRLYERKGFAATGATASLPPPREHIGEHERALDL